MVTIATAAHELALDGVPLVSTAVKLLCSYYMSNSLDPGLCFVSRQLRDHFSVEKPYLNFNHQSVMARFVDKCVIMKEGIT